jgi:hypothetical protein
VADTNIPLERLRRAVDIAKHRFKPESITFLNKANSNDLSVENSVDTELFENLRDEKTQQDLIKEYLKDYNVGEDTLNEVFALNSKYNKVVEESEDISRNVHWRIKKFSWDNLFNYGEGNSIDFDKLSGTVGIFGKNYSGASLMLYFTQFIIILLKIFERLTTLSTKTKIMDLVWWRLRLTIKLIRLVADRINTLRVRLQMKQRPKQTLIMWTKYQERLVHSIRRHEVEQTKQSETSSEI